MPSKLNSNPFRMVDPATLSVTDKDHLQEPPLEPNEGEMEAEQLGCVEASNMSGQPSDISLTLANLKTSLSDDDEEDVTTSDLLMLPQTPRHEGEVETGQVHFENAPVATFQGNSAPGEGSLNVKCLLCLDVSTSSMSFSRPNEEVYLKNLFAELGIYSSKSKLDRMKAEGSTIYFCTICRDQVVNLSSHVQQMIRAQMKVREELRGILNTARFTELNFQAFQKSCSTNNETTDRIRKKILIRSNILDPRYYDLHP